MKLKIDFGVTAFGPAAFGFTTIFLVPVLAAVSPALAGGVPLVRGIGGVPAINSNFNSNFSNNSNFPGRSREIYTPNIVSPTIYVAPPQVGGFNSGFNSGYNNSVIYPNSSVTTFGGFNNSVVYPNSSITTVGGFITNNGAVVNPVNQINSFNNPVVEIVKPNNFPAISVINVTPTGFTSFCINGICTSNRDVILLNNTRYGTSYRIR